MTGMRQASAHARRRWFQFGLGTLFVLLTLLGPALVAVKEHRDNVRLRERVEMLEKEIQGLMPPAAISNSLLFLRANQLPPDPMPIPKDPASAQRQELLNRWDLPERTFVQPESSYDEAPPKPRRLWRPGGSL